MSRLAAIAARACRRAAGMVMLAATVAMVGGRASAAEMIDAFDSVVQAARDGTLTVTETLRVHAEGRSMRHGIYRDFPLTFRDPSGTVREVIFSLLGVTRDGHPEPYHTERSFSSIRIYAGDKHVLITRGQHTYVFRYHTSRQIRWFDGKPELNWNVTGNYWNFPILHATYRMTLVDGLRPMRWTAYSGRLGARGTDWHGDIDNAGVLTVKTTRQLAPGEGLTVVAELPDGAVAAIASSDHKSSVNAAPGVETEIIPMKKNGGVYVVAVRFNDSITLDAVIDSGASDVSVPADVVLTLMRTRTVSEQDFLGQQTYVLADGSRVPSQRFRIRSLKVGDKIVENVVASIASVNATILLGQSFLSKFKSWSVDNENHTLILK